jgi:hypothetical protein
MPQRIALLILFAFGFASGFSDAAGAGPIEVPSDFGILDPGADATFQFILPGVSLGYAF